MTNSKGLGVLVTGAKGFLGSHLVEDLLSRGYTVYALDRPGNGSDNLAYVRNHPNLHVLEGDCSNPSSIPGLREAVSNSKAVCHIAGLTQGPLEDLIDANIVATTALYSFCNFNNPKLRFVYASSQTALGPVAKGSSNKREPCSNYGKSKLVAEHFLDDWPLEGERCPITILKLVGLYGPRDAAFLNQYQLVQKTKVCPTVGKLDSPTDVLYVKDAARAFVAAVENPNTANRIYEIADTRKYTRKQIIDAMAASIGEKRSILRVPDWLARFASRIINKLNPKSILGPDRMEDLLRLYPPSDPRRFMNDTGWRAEYPLQFASNLTARSYKNSRQL